MDTATCWLCLYALLESKRKVLWVLVVLFTLFWVPIAVLGYITVKSERYIPRVQIDIIGGYPCSFVVDPINPAIRSVASYLVAIRAFRALRLYSSECHKAERRICATAVLLIACIFVLYRRYHYRKFNNLLGVIQREGGIYLFAQVVIDVIAGLKSTKSITISDPYGIVSIVRVCIPPIFADRLLLKMHHKEDSEVTIVSTMRFDRGPPDPEETLDEGATRAENEKASSFAEDNDAISTSSPGTKGRVSIEMLGKRKGEIEEPRLEDMGPASRPSRDYSPL
ncbi:hypothetical protein NMY22_g10502 [Coprinellus aureogranulatus]|nr:hypothetical protein NMY22_g10502 [Coprinellus aureogranulatus]